jgi:hypothetical protein
MAKAKKMAMRRVRPQLYKISEEMKAWTAALAEEVRSWPEVRLRPMFGLFGVYRGDKIFAALPFTRSMDAPNTIGIKPPMRTQALRLRAHRDRRIHFSDAAGQWATFEITSNADVKAALECLFEAYEAAR